MTIKKKYTICECIFFYNLHSKSLFIEFFKKGRKFFETKIINTQGGQVDNFVNLFGDREVKEILKNEISYL